MTAHLLTEAECDALREEMFAAAALTTGPAWAAWMDAVQLLDKARSASFCTRAADQAGLSQVLPAQRARTLGLRYTR